MSCMLFWNYKLRFVKQVFHMDLFICLFERNPFSLNKSYSDLFDKSQFVKTHTRFRSVAPLTPLSLVLPPFPSLICVLLSIMEKKIY
ncbi:hypothetical protein M0811_14465 [Anaeramoeba ignava]|uniref:Uncharacterized protein n=1 Tax=Anaeramoeba ignava TaxID=1746090 RepID=A0A9Q0LYB0_ANAIG|nr:hypothetical protein M0811_14465 [Anaeramoeba ignava]